MMEVMSEFYFMPRLWPGFVLIFPPWIQQQFIQWNSPSQGLTLQENRTNDYKDKRAP